MSEKTIRVRIRVGVDAGGVWHACGWPGARREDMEEPALNALCGDAIRWCWVEADVPLPGPRETVIQGSVAMTDDTASRRTRAMVKAGIYVKEIDQCPYYRCRERGECLGPTFGGCRDKRACDEHAAAASPYAAQPKGGGDE